MFKKRTEQKKNNHSKINFNLTKLNKILLFLSLFYLMLYIPIAIITYNNIWYENNIAYNDLTPTQNEYVLDSINSVTDYLLHRTDSLNDNFSRTEKLHFVDVRNLLDKLFVMFLISFGFVFINIVNTIKRIREKLVIKACDLKLFSKINIVFFLLLTSILPVFKTFWSRIFHTLFFSNNYWLYSNNEISAVLFPITFFINATIFIILFGVITNIVIYFISRYILLKRN